MVFLPLIVALSSPPSLPPIPSVNSQVSSLSSDFQVDQSEFLKKVLDRIRSRGKKS